MDPLTTAEDDPDREHESQAEAPAPAAETPTRVRQAAAGMVEAQAWKGQQIAKGWRKLVSALRRREEGEGVGGRGNGLALESDGISWPFCGS